MTPTSRMALEIAEIPDIAQAMLGAERQAAFHEMGAWFRVAQPALMMTVARGSSAHAAAYLAHAVGRTMALPVVPVGLSLFSVFGTRLQADRAVALAISQSGSSPDLAQAAAALAGQGAALAVLTNRTDSALAQVTPRVIDMAAGPELAVAATKSYFASVLAGLWVLAHWAGDDALSTALAKLPKALRRYDQPLPAGVQDCFSQAAHLVVIGRGAGLGIAREVGLKLQELCGMHASAFSAAELLHGPRAMLSAQTPVIALRRGAGSGLRQAIDGMAGQGVPVHFVGKGGQVLHPLVDPLLDLMPLYRALEAAAGARGRSPDNPQHLKKETSTR